MILAQGAEARILKEENIIKERPKKGYRLPILDEQLRKFRTRREAKILDRLNEVGILAPRLLNMDDSSMKIEMSFIDGVKLRDSLSVQLAEEMGRTIGKLHENHIIHSDLTTSNMIAKNDKLHVIDFGLSFFSQKIEDKAVDLRVMDRALHSQHHENYNNFIKAAMKGYKETYPDANDVLSRLNVVNSRGRNLKPYSS